MNTLEQQQFNNSLNRQSDELVIDISPFEIQIRNQIIRYKQRQFIKNIYYSQHQLSIRLKLFSYEAESQILLLSKVIKFEIKNNHIKGQGVRLKLICQQISKINLRVTFPLKQQSQIVGKLFLIQNENQEYQKKRKQTLIEKNNLRFKELTKQQFNYLGTFHLKLLKLWQKEQQQLHSNKKEDAELYFSVPIVDKQQYNNSQQSQIKYFSQNKNTLQGNNYGFQSQQSMKKSNYNKIIFHSNHIKKQSNQVKQYQQYFKKTSQFNFNIEKTKNLEFQEKSYLNKKQKHSNFNRQLIGDGFCDKLKKILNEIKQIQLNNEKYSITKIEQNNKHCYDDSMRLYCPYNPYQSKAYSQYRITPIQRNKSLGSLFQHRPISPPSQNSLYDRRKHTQQFAKDQDYNLKNCYSQTNFIHSFKIEDIPMVQSINSSNSLNLNLNKKNIDNKRFDQPSRVGDRIEKRLQSFQKMKRLKEANYNKKYVQSDYQIRNIQKREQSTTSMNIMEQQRFLFHTFGQSNHQKEDIVTQKIDQQKGVFQRKPLKLNIKQLKVQNEQKNY